LVSILQTRRTLSLIASQQPQCLADAHAQPDCRNASLEVPIRERLEDLESIELPHRQGNCVRAHGRLLQSKEPSRLRSVTRTFELGYNRTLQLGANIYISHNLHYVKLKIDRHPPVSPHVHVHKFVPCFCTNLFLASTTRL